MSGKPGRRRGRERRRGTLLVRRTDRVEDAVAWLLVSLGLLAVVGAVLIGLAAHDAALRPGELGDVTAVRVTLLADVPTPATRRPPTPAPHVPVSFTAADGERTGELALRSPLTAGSIVTAWLDRQGRLSSTPPQHPSGAVAFGVGATLTAAAVAWALLTAAWSVVRRVTAARNDAAWTREWARVEPVWSRQVR